MQNLALDQSYIDLFSTLKHFLKSDHIRIRLETVESLSYIFNHKWISHQTTVDDGLSLTDIFEKLYADVYTNFPESLPADDMDKKSGDLAIRAQFHCSIVANCFCLRQENWFRLFELCCINVRIKKGKKQLFGVLRERSKINYIHRSASTEYTYFDSDSSGESSRRQAVKLTLYQMAPQIHQESK